ncbi:Flp family type IVb pilin [Photobacterium lipolyticum]|uniref:Flp family type IVb pilin n=1 Tax=Photobacterium lipolyticum TaxID=266810 RepID=A0A2T3N4P4_9GAMM|nr:Flp family type IVb pilin [Photobacterium lipolyticum]PSW07390.1 Flp family type IVb pilin [Photobacterium lipolyticum]
MMKLYTNTMAFLYTYKNDERGVTAIEYGLIGVAMAVALGLAFSDTGSIMQSLKAAYAAIGKQLKDLTPTA